MNSYAAASDSVPVSIVSSDDLPTDGNPISATRPSPYFDTSKPSPAPPLDAGACSSVRSLARRALSWPRWYSVALFFCVRAISASISLILFRGWWGVESSSGGDVGGGAAAAKDGAQRCRRRAACARQTARSLF